MVNRHKQLFVRYFSEKEEMTRITIIDSLSRVKALDSRLASFDVSSWRTGGWLQ